MKLLDDGGESATSHCAVFGRRDKETSGETTGTLRNTCVVYVPTPSVIYTSLAYNCMHVLMQCAAPTVCHGHVVAFAAVYLATLCYSP